MSVVSPVAQSVPTAAVATPSQVVVTTQMDHLPCSTGQPGQFRFREKPCGDCCQCCECVTRIIEVNATEGDVHFVRGIGLCCTACKDIYSQKSTIDKLVDVNTFVPSRPCACIRCFGCAIAALLSFCLLFPCFVQVCCRCIKNPRMVEVKFQAPAKPMYVYLEGKDADYMDEVMEEALQCQHRSLLGPEQSGAAIANTTRRIQDQMQRHRQDPLYNKYAEKLVPMQRVYASQTSAVSTTGMQMV